MQQQQQFMQYLHSGYAPQVATYQLAMKGEEEEENTENQSKLEDLLSRHQNSEQAVYYDPSVWLSTRRGSSVLEAADGQTGVLEPGANFTDRGFPERRTRLHGNFRAGGRAHSAVRAELLSGEETVRLPGLARLVEG
ncbi:unnamed protein product [Protopolystoma xenopodis]|uniref:Uncharacterized protein n=1 Tax=Protopolystoma xenopodis TaxID=117903 RepID=A0A3S5AC60_9PLAT|nr:unnamed protein product [Protopolystoma xenopodis]